MSTPVLHSTLWGVSLPTDRSLHPVPAPPHNGPHATASLTHATLVPTASDASLATDTLFHLGAIQHGKEIILASLKYPNALSMPLNLSFSMGSNPNFFVYSRPPQDKRFNVHISGFIQHVSKTMPAEASKPAQPAQSQAQSQAAKRKDAPAATSKQPQQQAKKAAYEERGGNSPDQVSEDEDDEDDDDEDDDEDERPKSVHFTTASPSQPAASPRSSVKQYPNGLIVQELVVGSGREAGKNARVAIRYKGELMNGKVFDSNMPRGAPLKFRIGGGDVIKGFEMGTMGMKVGGTRIVTIPAALGYGKRGAPPEIPGNATLKFTLQLVSVN